MMSWASRRCIQEVSCHSCGTDAGAADNPGFLPLHTRHRRRSTRRLRHVTCPVRLDPSHVQIRPVASSRGIPYLRCMHVCACFAVYMYTLDIPEAYKYCTARESLSIWMARSYYYYDGATRGRFLGEYAYH